jgi:hypothetical protein
MSYSDPNHTVRREHFAGATTAGATTTGLKFRSFQAMRLKNVHVAVLVAGTATTHKLDVMKGTTSVGTIALSTNTAGYTASADTSGPGLDVDFASLTDELSVKSGADATGTAQVIYEFEVLPSAVPTL